MPTAINGVAMPLIELIASLGTIAGAHGVGRIDVVEHRVVGVEAARASMRRPPPSCCTRRTRSCRQLVAPRELERFSRDRERSQYADIIYTASGSSPLRDALDAFVDNVQERVTGVVRLEAVQRRIARIVGTQSPVAASADDAGRSSKWHRSR